MAPVEDHIQKVKWGWKPNDEDYLKEYKLKYKVSIWNVIPGKTFGSAIAPNLLFLVLILHNIFSQLNKCPLYILIEPIICNAPVE